MQATGPDTIVKFLFTSGSTSLPKAVINTHRMWCANQQQMRQSMPVLADTDSPPVLVDWLPWNHTFGGNHNFGMVIYNGGTLSTAGNLVFQGTADGRVVAYAALERGTPLVVLEAMKMEHTLRAPVAGIATVSVRAGEKVAAQQVLARVASGETDG